MERKELYLKTLFCCSACDGDIAPEEIELVKQLVNNVDSMPPNEAEKLLNEYVVAINKEGSRFLSKYLSEVKNAILDEAEQLKLIDLAIKMIEADNIIQYSEVKFFKKIRNLLSISDTMILENHPNIEDFLLPDIKQSEEPEWNDNITFSEISLDSSITNE